MTRTKALLELDEYSRALITPDFAEELSKALGYSLKELKLEPKKSKDQYRAEYVSADELTIGTYLVAVAIAQKLQPDFRPTSRYSGWGRTVETYTEQAIEVIKNNPPRKK